MKRREIGNLLRWIGWGGAVKDACAPWTHLVSLYADAQATPQQARRVEAHLEACARCRASLALLRATTQVAATWRESDLPAGLSERLQRAIADEARKQRVEALDVDRSARRRFGAPHIAISGAVFAALAFGVYFVDHHGLPTPVRPGSVAVNPVHVPTPLPGMSVPHGNKPTAVAGLTKPRHASVPNKTVVAELPREAPPSIAEQPVSEQAQSVAPSVPRSIHPNVSHSLQIANAVPTHPGAVSHPHMKPLRPGREVIANAVKPPVTVPRDPGLPDDDEDMTTPAPPAAVVASAPKPIQDTPVVTLASTIRSLARNTQRIAPGTDQISVTMAHTANYTGAATIVGSEIH